MKRENPQMTIQRFKSLDSLDEIEKGTTIFRRNDQSKVHWEMTKFKITGASETHLLCEDTEGKPVAFPFEQLAGLYIIKM